MKSEHLSKKFFRFFMQNFEFKTTLFARIYGTIKFLFSQIELLLAENTKINISISTGFKTARSCGPIMVGTIFFLH